MTTSPHKTAALGQIHSPVNWSFATRTARQAVGPYVLTDLGSESMQTDTTPPTFWKLVGVASPGLTATPTWRQITTAADGFAGDLSQFFTAGTVLQSVQSDLGITTGATFTWSDQSGNGKHYTQTVSGKQPTLTTGLSGKPGIRFTYASAQLLTSSLNLPAPGTTPTWIGVVWRNIAFHSASRPWCSVSSETALTAYSAGSDEKLTQFSGSGGNVDVTPPTFGTWECSEFYYSNSAADYIKRGSAAAVTGTGAGNGTGTGRVLGGNSIYDGYDTDSEFLHIIYVNSKQPTAIANWRAAVASWAGGSVAV